jgi:predicted phage terminase large subunit-like protein
MAAEIVLSEKALRHFIRAAWHVLEPTTSYIDGWHIDAISEHLEALTFGDIKRLIINVPPRHMKSLSACVFWPAWEWGPMNIPSSRWLFSSYAELLSTRDSLKCRRLIQSPWYQARWGDRFALTPDQNAKTRFENDKQGYRIATSVRGVGTGEGGDHIVVDDAHNVIKAESASDLLTTLLWWDESMSSRGNNPNTVTRLIIMQRVGDRDIVGHNLAKDIGYEHLCLPARYEKKHPFPLKTSIMEKDPRTKEGQPLWPGLYDDEALKQLEKDMTEHARAGQLQQRPQARGGGIFKVEHFQLVSIQPGSNVIKKAVRYWDKAGTDGGGARTGGVLMVKMNDGKVRICHVKKGQWSAGKRETIIKQHAEMDDNKWPGIRVHQVVEQEPGSGGKESAESTLNNLMGHVVKRDPAHADKVARSEPYQAALENDNVEIVNAEWTQEFIDEHETAPKGKFKDQWDSASGAYNYLHRKAGKSAGTW